MARSQPCWRARLAGWQHSARARAGPPLASAPAAGGPRHHRRRRRRARARGPARLVRHARPAEEGRGEVAHVLLDLQRVHLRGQATADTLYPIPYAGDR